MHVHAGFLAFLITWAHVILALFLMRYIAAKYPDSAIGKAMAAIN